MPTVLDLFIQWCATRDIWLDERIELRYILSPDQCNPGCGVFARAFIPAATTIARIPKLAILSVKTSTIGQAVLVSQPSSQPRLGFESKLSSLESVDPRLALSFALLAEWLEGENSPWWPYLQMLPWKDPPPIALFWIRSPQPDDQSVMSTIFGSDLYRKLNREGVIVHRSIEEYYQSTVNPILTYKFAESGRFHSENGLDMFKVAYALVSSRAFIVDVWHGLAMVPIADAFNHTEDYGVCMHTEYDVCYICGELYHCSHDSPPPSPTSIQPASRIDEEADTADMITSIPHRAKEEIFNTYSHSRPLTNVQLLLQYGFVEEGASGDSVAFELDEVLRVVDGGTDARGIEKIKSEQGELVIDSDGEPSDALWKVLIQACVDTISRPDEQLVSPMVAVAPKTKDVIGQISSDTNLPPVLDPSGTGNAEIEMLDNGDERDLVEKRWLGYQRLALLCKNRLQGLQCAGDMSALNKALDNVQISQPKTRLAYQYLIGEVSLLTACLEKCPTVF